ncbi:MAG TPA: hypothetical protein VFZ66_27970 [Herpetosiphonaceae bacterium]
MTDEKIREVASSASLDKYVLLLYSCNKCYYNKCCTMPELTENEIALLHLIDRVTRENGGQNPTLAEIALAAGLPSSGRATIQRQLSRLRPTYVDWSGSARSLHLTPAGLAELGRGTSTAAITAPINDVIVSLLAVGLTHLTTRIELDAVLHAPYHDAWERGARMLAFECLIRGLPAPAHLGVVINDWCRHAPRDWPLPLGASGRLYDEPLLNEDNELTPLCRELAHGLEYGDAELELCEAQMGVVRTLAQGRRSQDGYVAFRRFVIEHPVATQDEISDAAAVRTLTPFAAHLHELYERIPTTAIHHGHLLLCGHCGWTLERMKGRLRCGSPRCRVLTENFSRGTATRPFNTDDPPLRVRRAIRQYVVAPGIYELNLVRQVEALGLTCQLWPFYDRYDVRVIFDDGTTWAVDLKDWQHPHLLGRHLTTFADEAPDWRQFFFAIPDARLAENAAYLTILRELAGSDAFTILTISDLVARITRRKEQGYA